MGVKRPIDLPSMAIAAQEDGADTPTIDCAPDISGEMVIGVLVGLDCAERIPYVVYPRQEGTAAVAARTTLGLHRTQVGRSVVLMLGASMPIILGVIRDAADETAPASLVEINADGRKLVVCARQELVLRCGRASITLTQAGKVLIQGTYISSRSTGVNRLRGGSIQLN